MAGGNSPQNNNDKWKLAKEKILFIFGLTLLGAEFVNAEIFGRTFHYEFIIGSLALCGISLALWGDKR